MEQVQLQLLLMLRLEVQAEALRSAHLRLQEALVVWAEAEVQERITQV